MTEKVINRKTSNPWSQRKLFTGNLDKRLVTSNKHSKRAHIAVVSTEFFESLAVAVLGGRRGALNSEADICPDLHIKRGSEPTLVEVKGGTRRRYFKCDTRQLVKYKGCGERVEYAFIAYDYKSSESVSQHVDTIKEVYEYLASRISYMVVLDVSVVHGAWKAGIFSRRKYDSWVTDKGAFDCVYANQKFMRNIIAEGGMCWAMDTVKLVFRKRQRRAGSVEVAGVKFQVNSFPLVELVRPNSEIPF